MLAAVAFVLGSAGCRESHMAARVGDATISTHEVDQIIEHAREEAKHEGKDFPTEGTARFRLLERQALDLLVYHVELEQQAATLGVTLSDRELEKALSASAGTEADSSSEEVKSAEAFRKESLRGQILYRRIYERVTRNVSANEVELRAYYRAHADQYRTAGSTFVAARSAIRGGVIETKRNALMARWIAHLNHLYAGSVTYAAEFKSPK
jgi:SurA-like protein